MNYGIAIVTLLPCREEPSDKSQMVSQLLFGEHFIVLQKEKKWSLIKNALDGYESWIDNKQYVVINESLFKKLEEDAMNRSTDDVSIINVQGQKQYLVKGSCISKHILNFLKVDIQTKIPVGKSNPALYAREYLNSPYLWGGRSHFGIDCSGLTQICFLLSGKIIPRDAHQQSEVGEIVDFVEEAQEGDLAFFDNEEGKIIHVGIVLTNHYIIHASGKVRIDRFDHQGVFNEETGSYSHNLRIIKRLG